MTGMIKKITVNGLTVITRMTRMAGMTGMWVWMTDITRPMIGMTTVNGLTVMTGLVDWNYWDDYRIYSITRPGHLLNFWTLRVGAY